ncbi:MAG: helix-turn-helix transcriptional regulator [Flavobacteriales bacterium]|nr:helix-turn-helix transcriptional regulator [Flavobacteriales bacterium]
MSYFGTNIKKIRQLKGLSQTQFGELVNLNRGVVSSYEEGRAEPKIETLLRISDHFELSTDDLLKKKLTVNQIANYTEAEKVIQSKLLQNLELEKKDGIIYEVQAEKLKTFFNHFIILDNPQDFYQKGDLLLLIKLNLNENTLDSREYIVNLNGFIFIDKISVKEENLTLIKTNKTFKISEGNVYSVVTHLSTTKDNKYYSKLFELEKRIENLEKR